MKGATFLFTCRGSGIRDHCHVTVVEWALGYSALVFMLQMSLPIRQMSYDMSFIVAAPDSYINQKPWQPQCCLILPNIPLCAVYDDMWKFVCFNVENLVRLKGKSITNTNPILFSLSTWKVYPYITKKKVMMASTTNIFVVLIWNEVNLTWKYKETIAH